MNIERLKQLVSSMPDEIGDAQFGSLEVEFEDLLAQQRQADIAALGDYEQRIAKLREKLGVKVTKPAPIPVRVTGETDFDNGITYSDGNTDNASFQAELAQIRQRNVERRRSRGQH